MFSQALVTGAAAPVTLPFAYQLLRQDARQLLLCDEWAPLQALRPSLLAWQRQQACAAELRFFPFGRSGDLLPWHQLNEPADPDGPECTILLLHSQGLRCTRQAHAHPGRALRANLLLTRQVLQEAIAESPHALLVISSDHARDTTTVLGASLAAAEASLLEAASHLQDTVIRLLRFPAGLEPSTHGDGGLEPDQAWRREQAVRAALSTLSAIDPPQDTTPLLIEWPDPLHAPQQLHHQPLVAGIPQPRQPLLHWLNSIAKPLQNEDDPAIARALLSLWAG